MSASLATRRVLATLLAAGTLIGAATLPAAADDHRRDHRGPHSPLVIGDVQYDSPSRHDRSNRALNREWVEIKNT
ncbi:lamin tail domain-containing protein, partial [Streptomyces virginiae]